MNKGVLHSENGKMYVAARNGQPLVTIAMPVYNAEKFLRQSIDSVLEQTYRNIELVLVNDASTDQSAAIIHSYSDPRIRYYENERNLGIAATRNKCIDLAQGDYIAVLDNDDIAGPDRIERQVQFLDLNEDYGMCGSFWKIIDQNGRAAEQIKTPIKDADIRTYLVFNNCFCNSSIMIRSHLLKEFMYPEEFSMIEDYYFLYTQSKRTRLAILPHYLTYYRVHGQNASIEKLEKMRLLRKQMDALILNELEIPHSKEELELHTHFLSGNFSYFNNGIRAMRLQRWLLKLYGKMAKRDSYEMKVVRHIFIRRWLMTLQSNPRLLHLVFYNRLLLRHPLPYLRYLVEMLADRLSRKTHLT
jgi:glycosyltransferase involved in cell wall biosynthesis